MFRAIAYVNQETGEKYIQLQGARRGHVLYKCNDDDYGGPGELVNTLVRAYDHLPVGDNVALTQSSINDYCSIIATFAGTNVELHLKNMGRRSDIISAWVGISESLL